MSILLHQNSLANSSLRIRVQKILSLRNWTVIPTRERKIKIHCRWCSEVKFRGPLHNTDFRSAFRMLLIERAIIIEETNNWWSCIIWDQGNTYLISWSWLCKPRIRYEKMRFTWSVWDGRLPSSYCWNKLGINGLENISKQSKIRKRFGWWAPLDLYGWIAGIGNRQLAYL